MLVHFLDYANVQVSSFQPALKPMEITHTELGVQASNKSHLCEPLRFSLKTKPDKTFQYFSKCIFFPNKNWSSRESKCTAEVAGTWQ